eukprot:5629033-Pleurochrysis_carterae.AAC.1
MNKAFQRWRTNVKHEDEERTDGKVEGDKRLENERTYGIKNWDTKNPRNGCLRSPEAYILVRGVNTIPYHTSSDNPGLLDGVESTCT